MLMDFPRELKPWIKIHWILFSLFLQAVIFHLFSLWCGTPFVQIIYYKAFFQMTQKIVKDNIFKPKWKIYAYWYEDVLIFTPN